MRSSQRYCRSFNQGAIAPLLPDIQWMAVKSIISRLMMQSGPKGVYRKIHITECKVFWGKVKLNSVLCVYRLLVNVAGSGSPNLCIAAAANVTYFPLCKTCVSPPLINSGALSLTLFLSISL